MTADFFERAQDLDMRLLRYFALVAEEGGMRRAAERLFISQPPLSRQIRKLEEALGVSLFTRHSKGMELTPEGRKVLEAILPLLRLHDETMAKLSQLGKTEGRLLRVGLTTAFEQGVFSRLEKTLEQRHGDRLRLSRGPSPRLAAEVRKGKLDVALVALPLETQGLDCGLTGYSESLAAALPQNWATTRAEAVPLADFSGKPLFWFRRESAPAFFDFTRAVFAQAGFSPVLLEEPAEHDVLLARIAAGEGMGLMAESFAAISRSGVVFLPLIEKELLRLELGLITLPGRYEALREEVTGL